MRKSTATQLCRFAFWQLQLRSQSISEELVLMHNDSNSEFKLLIVFSVDDRHDLRLNLSEGCSADDRDHGGDSELNVGVVVLLISVEILLHDERVAMKFPLV
jgi:hypothetical protein